MADDRSPADRERSRLDEAAERGGQAVERVRHRSGQASRIRARQWEVTLVISAQAGLAAAIAALIAKNLLGPDRTSSLPPPPSVRSPPPSGSGPGAPSSCCRCRPGHHRRRRPALPPRLGAVADRRGGCAGHRHSLLVAGKGGALVGQAGGTAVLIATLAPMERGLELPGSSTRSSAAWSACWWSRCCCRSIRCGCWTGRLRRSSRSSATNSRSWRRRCGSATPTGRFGCWIGSAAPTLTSAGCTTR